MRDIKVIAFDLDGTLVDSLQDLAISANATRNFFNLPNIDISILKSYIGDGIYSLVKKSLDQENDEKILEKGFNFFCKYYYEHITDNTNVYKNVSVCLELLQTLKIPLAIITNKNDIFATKILKNLNLINYFSLIIGGNTLSDKKPSAIPILHVCKIFNIPPENMLMVGDSKNDVLSAKNANCLSILVNYGYANTDELSKNPVTKPNKVINDIIELYDIVKNANKE